MIVAIGKIPKIFILRGGEQIKLSFFLYTEIGIIFGSIGLRSLDRSHPLSEKEIDKIETLMLGGI